MTGRRGRAGGWLIGVALLAGACSVSGATTDTSDGRPAVIAAVPSEPRLVLPLKGTALPAGIEPGGLDADRFAFTDDAGVGVLNLDLGSSVQLPKPPHGIAFRPTALGVNLIVGDVTGALSADRSATTAIAYDISNSVWVDAAAKLPAGHASTAVATDGQVIVGMDLGAPGSKAAARAYALDTSSGTVAYLPNLPSGGVPVPRAVGGGRVAGAEAEGDLAKPGDGWVWDLAAGGYTMLASAGAPAGAVPASITDDTVVGSIGGAGSAGEHPFLFDAAAKHFTDLGMAGFGAEDISDSGVLLVPASGWTGIIRDTTTGAQVSLDAVVVDGRPTGVRPWALSDGWLIGLTAPDATSKAAFGRVVAIDIGEGP